MDNDVYYDIKESEKSDYNNESSVDDKLKYYIKSQKIFDDIKERIPTLCKIKRHLYNNTSESIASEPLFIFKSHVISFSFDKNTNEVNLYLNECGVHDHENITRYSELQDLPFDEGIIFFYLERNLNNLNYNNLDYTCFLQNIEMVSKCPFEYKSFLMAIIENRFFMLKFTLSVDRNYVYCIPS